MKQPSSVVMSKDDSECDRESVHASCGGFCTIIAFVYLCTTFQETLALKVHSLTRNSDSLLIKGK